MTEVFKNKSPEMIATLESLFPGTLAAVKANCCPMCKQPIGEFKNELSRKEYTISGICQTCQDDIFG